MTLDLRTFIYCHLNDSHLYKEPSPKIDKVSCEWEKPASPSPQDALSMLPCQAHCAQCIVIDPDTVAVEYSVGIYPSSNFLLGLFLIVFAGNAAFSGWTLHHSFALIAF